MTGNQIKGKGFRGALRYNLDKVDRHVAEILDSSFASLSEKSIMKEVRFVRILRPNLQKYFYHTSINFPPSENLSNQMMKQIGHDYLKANGFTQHQFIMFRHRDADHPHLHILVNRIGYDGNVLSDSNDYKRSENVLRDLETKYNLTRVTPSNEVKARAMTKDELEMMKRTNQPSQKMAMQVTIKNVLKEKPRLTTAEFIQALQAKGVNVLFNQATTGFVSGISYGYQGFMIKGAKLGTDFKWASIKNVINYEQERDRAIIQETNTKTKTQACTETVKAKQGSEIDHDHKSRTDHSLFETSKGFDPISLLNDLTQGDHRFANHQSDLDSESISNRRKRKKKRRGRRM